MYFRSTGKNVVTNRIGLELDSVEGGPTIKAGRKMLIQGVHLCRTTLL